MRASNRHLLRLPGSPIRKVVEASLTGVFERAARLPLTVGARIVVLSDLHMGDGGPRDDFRHNGTMVQAILRDYYFERGYSLVLNGDIEELQRSTLAAVRARWTGMYELFDAFAAKTALCRIVGNHDDRLWSEMDPAGLREAVRLERGDQTILIFHGHQATIFFERFNGVSELFLRSVANALHIGNIPVSYESRRRFITERRVYDFSVRRRILSVIGHTHRPLFESLSKIDSLKYRIEQLCREYPFVSRLARTAIEKRIEVCKAELIHLLEKDPRSGNRDSLYNDAVCVPCLFNSGCAIGKRGITAIEFLDGRIALVHWYDTRRGPRHRMNGAPGHSSRLPDTPYHRMVLKQDHLSYLFSRVKLLA